MNIFILDEDPQLAAQYLANKHVVKMILESAQLLCTAHHIRPAITYTYPSVFYKKTHENHPCAIWCRETSGNYFWLASHAIELCKEYTFRYGKIHKTQSLIEWLEKHFPYIKSDFMTDFPQCMPEIYKRSNVVEAYRAYYIYDKMKKIQCNWTKREKPFWIKEANDT